jgi:hypothetical protein
MALGLWITKEKKVNAIDMKGPNITPITLKNLLKKGNMLFMSRNVNRLLQKRKYGEKIGRKKRGIDQIMGD